MKFVEPKVWEYKQEKAEDGVYKAIRDAAAICYQTDTDKIVKTPREFMNMLLEKGHGRPLEFGTVYLVVRDCKEHQGIVERYGDDPWSRVNYFDGYFYITTNMRVVMRGSYFSDFEAYHNGYEYSYIDDLEFECEPLVHHSKRRTFCIWASRGCTDDLRTHTSLSSICESTRFCNYNKDKFNSELTFIEPYWGLEEGMEELLSSIEDTYREYARRGYEPQQLKRILPLDIKAELRLCGYDDAWRNFFWRRCDKYADPECIRIAESIREIYDSNDHEDKR